jgi:hypothetical protein
MSVTLEAIKFNHDPNSAKSDALNIRRNATQFIDVPEWRRGISVNPQDSLVAYAIKETKGQQITIQAKFRRRDSKIATVQVRAVDPLINPPRPRGCLEVLLWLLRRILRALFGNVLGEVKARTVSFLPSGETAFESFELKNVRLWSAGIGIRTTTWQWQYRLESNTPWIDIETSRHRVYSLLEVPKLPWQQTPYNAGNTQLPWTEVLDYACRWAFLMGSLDEAAARVTRNIYDLGPSVIEYDCPNGGSTHYSFGSFNCTAFLERLNGGPGNGQYVNCTDCATIVSTFANILGCDLWQSRMQWSFGLNPILAIGSAAWYPGCQNWPSQGFSYHEVAWKGACTSEDNIFDGCLLVDGDADPTTAPHTPLLPTNMRFGLPGDGDYRDRLATPATRPNCEPAPSTKQRRMVV